MHQDDQPGSPTSLLPGMWSDPDATFPIDVGPGLPDEPRGRHRARPADPAPDGGSLVGQAADQIAERVLEWYASLRLALTQADRRWLVGAVILVPTLAVFGVVALLPGTPRSTPTTAPAATRSTAPTGSAPGSAAPVAERGVRGLTAIDADQTAALLGRSGQSVRGDLDQGWTFRDANGLNLMVATVETVGPSDYTMRVSLIGDLEGSPKPLARLADSGLPGCSAPLRGNGDKGSRKERRNRKGNRGDVGDDRRQEQPAEQPAPPVVLGSAGFTSDSVTLGDVDRDGVGEVTIGWSSSCGDVDATSRIRLTMVSGSASYLAQGEGVIGAGSGSGSGAGSGGSFEPEPDPSSWPAGYLDSLRRLFSTIYY